MILRAGEKQGWLFFGLAYDDHPEGTVIAGARRSAVVQVLEHVLRLNLDD